jgi:hypothetical protein
MLRIVNGGGGAVDDGERERLHAAAVAAITSALGHGMRRCLIIYETADAMGYESVECGPATMRGLVVEMERKLDASD